MSELYRWPTRTRDAKTEGAWHPVAEVTNVKKGTGCHPTPTDKERLRNEKSFHTQKCTGDKAEKTWKQVDVPGVLF